MPVGKGDSKVRKQWDFETRSLSDLEKMNLQLIDIIYNNILA